MIDSLLLYFVSNCQEKNMKRKLLEPKIILLVGMMGVGKTSLGRILSRKLQLPFVDSDKEIEKSMGSSITELFSKFGADEFHLGEERMMNRLLNGAPCVLSSGGDAFLSAKTRQLAKEKAVSIWLKAGGDVISKRTQGRTHRPLVPAADNRKIVEQLIAERYPLYSEADITVESFCESPYRTVNRLLAELESRSLIATIPDEETPASTTGSRYKKTKKQARLFNSLNKKQHHRHRRFLNRTPSVPTKPTDE